MPTSCSTPTIGLASQTVPAGGNIRLEVTGPEAYRYAAWIDAASASGTGITAVATPRAPGETPELVLPTVSLTACTITTTQPLGPEIKPGDHLAVLFRVGPDGTTYTQVADVALTVS